MLEKPNFHVRFGSSSANINHVPMVHGYIYHVSI